MVCIHYSLSNVNRSLTIGIQFSFSSQSGFMCMMFYRRDTHIAEIQMGVPASRLEDACTVDNFDVAKLPYVTLVGK